MPSLHHKFQGHAQILKSRIEHPGGFNNGADTAHVSFEHDGEQYTVTVTSNSKLLTASLWLKGKCIETVIGKDKVLFVGQANK
jgi:hypothetical protein